jgi:hypothetical protein
VRVFVEDRLAAFLREPVNAGVMKLAAPMLQPHELDDTNKGALAQRTATQNQWVPRNGVISAA